MPLPRLRRVPLPDKAQPLSTRSSGPSGEGIDWVVVGHVRGAFGVRGEIKVEPINSLDDTVLFDLADWRIRLDAQTVSCQVTSVREHGRYLVAATTLGLDREGVEALKGAVVEVDRARFPALEDDEYYWSDLIGCEVSSVSGQALGTVAGIDDHGAHSVLRLDDGLLIPFVQAHVLEVDCASRRIVVDWAADWR